MRSQIDRYTAGLAENFSICVHPQRNGASDREALAFACEEALETHVISIVSSGKDPEEIHAVKVIGAEEIQDPVSVDRIGAEFKASSFVACVHYDSK